MDADLPNEVLASIFAFVLGHPASGALCESRLVCKRWREIIDAHLGCRRPAEPYRTAYRLGYLSPQSIFNNQEIVVADLEREGNHLRARTVFVHDISLARWLLTRLARGSAILGLVSLRDVVKLIVQCGVWDLLPVGCELAPALIEHTKHIHPTDVPRARHLIGVDHELLDDSLPEIFLNGDLQEVNYAGWTDHDFTCAEIGRLRTREALPALPWLLSKGHVPAEYITRWLRTLREANAMESPAGRELISDVIEYVAVRGWTDVLKPDDVIAFFAYRPENGWPLVMRMIDCCQQTTRDLLWRPNWQAFNHAIIIYLFNLGFPESARANEALDWLHSRGFYSADISQSDADLIYLALVKVRGAAAYVMASLYEWFATHLRPPTHVGVLMAFVQGRSNDVAFQMLLKHRAPWDPLRLPSNTSWQVIDAIFDAGYTLPESMSVRQWPNDSRVIATWVYIFEAAAARGRLSLNNFDLEFLRLACFSESGRLLLGRIVKMGLALPMEIRAAVYRTVLPGDKRAERHEQAKAESKDEEALYRAVKDLIKKGLPPADETMRGLARWYRSRVFTAPHTSTGVRVPRVVVKPDEVVEMRCLIALGEAFPTYLPVEVSEILAEVGVVSVATAHRAGYPLSPRLGEIFAARGNEVGARWLYAATQLLGEVGGALAGDTDTVDIATS